MRAKCEVGNAPRRKPALVVTPDEILQGNMEHLGYLGIAYLAVSMIGLLLKARSRV